jgi:hypothetical protein
MIMSFIMWLSIQIGEAFASILQSVGGRGTAGRVTDTIRAGRHQRQELADLKRLYHRVGQYADRAEVTCQGLALQVVTDTLAHTPDKIDGKIFDISRQLCVNLLRCEGFYPVKDIDFNRNFLTSEIWDVREKMSRQLELFENPHKAEQIEKTLRLFVKTLVVNHLSSLPTPAESDEATISLPLHTFYTDPADTIEAICGITETTVNESKVFHSLYTRLSNNFLVASGIDPNQLEHNRRPVILPSEANMSPPELVENYLNGTPFLDYFTTPFAYALPVSARFEHTHIVWGSGHGKTQLLQNLFMGDLARLKDGKASIIVIDSQGDMIRNIRQLALVGELPERVVLIDPNDIAYPPALNFFDFGLDRIDRYDPVEREKLMNGAIALYEYVFGALLGAELTQRQGVIFRYLARLMMGVPGATIHTLMEFMEEPETTRAYLNRLDPIAKHFFESQFYSKKFDDTRQQILTRLWGVLSNSVLARMFANERNKLNLFEAMNSGSLILINTAKELLKQDGCEIIGRFFIALICQAAQERASIPESKRQDTFVYIDEAHDYFDESMENLLNQARKYKVGLVLAHQNLDQFESKLRATVMSSTSIKMVGGLSAKDAAMFAREMNCEVEFLQSIRKYADRTEFACNVRNHTPNPISLSVPFGSMERQPKITAERAAFMLEHNRARYCASHEAGVTLAVERKLEAHPIEKPELL